MMESGQNSPVKSGPKNDPPSVGCSNGHVSKSLAPLLKLAGLDAQALRDFARGLLTSI